MVGKQSLISKSTTFQKKVPKVRKSDES